MGSPPTEPPFPPGSPRSPIANAETLPTPALPPHLGGAPSQLGMPPGMTVAPALPPARLQSADDEPGDFDEEHHADPAEVIAHHQAEARESAARESGARDVLAGWGWGTGSTQSIDDDYVDETGRAGRKRLLLAIGGALGAVVIILIVAIAFGGSKKPEQDDATRARSSATAPSHSATAPPPSAPETAPPPTEPPKGEPGAPAPEANAAPPAEPPKTEPAGAPPPSGALPGEPSKLTTEPPRPEPPATSEPPSAEPPKEPAKAAVTAPPPRPETAAAAAPPTRPEPTRPLGAKKPPEPKRLPDRPVRRPLPPDRIAKTTARAQPVDPYGASERTRVDPAAAYRTGLQQYARGDTAGALATFRGSVANNPGFAPTWRGLGLVYEKLGNRGQARQAFKRYLQLAPTAGDADQIRDRMERLGS
jgi:hypothetical protein